MHDEGSEATCPCIPYFATRLWAKEGRADDDPDGYVCPFCERERAKGTAPGY